MSEYIKSCLDSIGFSHLYEKFMEEEFTDESFKHLDVDILKEILSKAGPRNSFWVKYKEFFGIHQGSRSYSPSVGGWSTPTTSKSYPLFQSQQNSTDQQDTLTTFTNNQLILEPTEVQFIDASSPSVSRTSSRIFDDLLSALKTPTDCGTVKNCLKSTTGKIIEGHFNKFGKLENTQRNLLATLIINKEHENIGEGPFKLTTERFVTLANEIPKIFPSENSFIYFVPYNKVTKRVASGKLWERYNRLKKNLKIISETTVTNENSLNSIPSENEDVEGKILFLKSHVNDWEKIRAYWKETYAFRKRQLQGYNEILQIHNYLSFYPALRGPQGGLLLSDDFNIQYPALSDILFLKWPEINNKLKKLATQRTSSNISQKRENISPNKSVSCSSKKSSCTLDKLLKSDCDIAGLQLLAYFLSSSVYGKKKENQKRLKFTKEEVLDSFILHVLDANLLKEELDRKRKLLESSKQTLQPLVIAAGPTLEEAKYFYVVLDHVLYSAENILTAVNLCFKVFMSLNAKYPESCLAIWTFIQHEVFGIFTEFDVNLVALGTLKSDLNAL